MNLTIYFIILKISENMDYISKNDLVSILDANTT